MGAFLHAVVSGEDAGGFAGCTKEGLSHFLGMVSNNSVNNVVNKINNDSRIS